MAMLGWFLFVLTVLVELTTYSEARIPAVYNGGGWESAHATFFRGSDASGTMGSIHLVQAQTDQQVKNGGNKKREYNVLVVASVTSAIVVIVTLLVIFICKRKRRSSQDASSSNTIEKKSFSLVELKAMKKNFKKRLGKETEGDIEHGYMTRNGEYVTIKVLPDRGVDNINYNGFKEQVEILLTISHKHLVKLVGYCDEENQSALIYEYMANGDLKEHLSARRGGSPLQWPNRLKIAFEAALGLEYLHNNCNPQIIHRDITSEKIMFDEQFQTKLCFGISTSFQEEDNHLTRAIIGTTGCQDPEYFITGRMTVKSDIFSFGVVLLQLITNQLVIMTSREVLHITEWAAIMLVKGDINNILDPSLHLSSDSPGVRRFIDLAVSCTNHSSAKRPDISQVVSELKACLSLNSDDLRTQENLDIE